MLHGSRSDPAAPCPYVGNIVANTRLGIPQIRMNDGPQGFRVATHKVRAMLVLPLVLLLLLLLPTWTLPVARAATSRRRRARRRSGRAA